MGSQIELAEARTSRLPPPPQLRAPSGSPTAAAAVAADPRGPRELSGTGGGGFAVAAARRARYCQAMRQPNCAAVAARRALVTAVAAVAVAACAEPPRAVPPKPPNDELILGVFERRPPSGETAIRFRADGSVRVAKTRALLDSEPPLATGTWKLDGGRLTLTYDHGMCAEPSDAGGTYTVVISRIGVHFTRVEDACARRAAIDGQTWWRAR